MRKLLLLVLCFVFFLTSGCNTVTISIDGTPLSEDKATVIVFTHYQYKSYEIYMDEMSYGVVAPKKHLKFEVVPGTHSIYAKSTGIDKVATFVLDAGKTYYLEVYVELGVIHTNRIRQAPPCHSYTRLGILKR